MADDIDNRTAEMLRRVHTKLDDIQAEMRLRFTGVETGLATLDHHLAAFHAVDAARLEEIADLRRRLERVSGGWNWRTPSRRGPTDIALCPRPTTQVLCPPSPLTGGGRAHCLDRGFAPANHPELESEDSARCLGYG